MIWRTLLISAIGTLTLTYTPTAPEILSKMAAGFHRGKPVQLRVVREDPDGLVLEEAVLTVPLQAGSAKESTAFLDLPYSTMTLPVEELSGVLHSTSSESAKVTLGRLNGKVCYILEGIDERLWLSKNGLLPLKIESKPGKHFGTVYLYTNMTHLSKAVWYPSRTEVWRDGKLLLVERLLTESPPASGP